MVGAKGRQIFFSGKAKQDKAWKNFMAVYSLICPRSGNVQAD